VADTGKPANVIDPIWEYNHDVASRSRAASSIAARRSRRLQGAYIYADYVAGKLWALRYDPRAEEGDGQSPDPRQRESPVMSFGTDKIRNLFHHRVREGAGGV